MNQNIVKENYCKKLLSAFLIILIIFMDLGISSGVQEEVTHHRLDTGVVFVWKSSSGQWQRGWSPGSQISFNASYSLPKDALEVEVDPYMEEASLGSPGYFNFSDSRYYHWNKEAAYDAYSYNAFYNIYSVTMLSANGASSYNPATGQISLNLSMRLTALGGTPYDVKAQLALGAEGKAKIINLLGNPSQEIIDAMNLMDPTSEEYNPNVEGYLYFIPIVFKYVLLEEVEDEPVIEPERDIQGQAILDLPPETYEGHPVEAEDWSTFIVDGQDYMAYRMYQEKLASNAFTAGGHATIRRTDLTTADISFNQAGAYPVTLKVTSKYSQVWTDTKSILVKNTPYILANLGGVQKENRRQDLNISVAKNPSFPLRDLWVEIEGISSGEKVRLTHNLETGGNSLENSETIKTRAIELVSENPYFLNIRLPFLTKNESQENFLYRIYVKDERGKSHQIENEFLVKEDKPPQGIISLPSEFLRKQGTNTARIEAQDISISDGDQLERKWRALPLDGNDQAQLPAYTNVEKLPGFEDQSFGQRKEISFEKTGVGKVLFSLGLKDIWTEPTLEEYILLEDYKESMVAGETEVINIAPQIRGTPLKFEEAQLLLIAKDKEEKQRLAQEKNSLYRSLLEKEIDGEILLESLPPNISTDPGIRGYYKGPSTSLLFGFSGRDTFLDTNWFSADDENIYTINGLWPSGSAGTFPGEPFTITSIGGESKSVNWTLAVTSELFNINPKTAGSFAHDNQGKYLYFRNNGKTLVIAKDTGAYLTILPVMLGNKNYVDPKEGKYIYSFNNQGIISVNTRTGDIQNLLTGNLGENSGEYQGKVHFTFRKSSFNLLRGMLDLSNGSIEYTRLETSAGDGVNASYQCLGIDTEGRLFVGVNGNKSVRVFDDRNSLIKTISGWVPSGASWVTPVYREDGRASYLAVTWEGKTDKGRYYTYQIHTGVWGVDNDDYAKGLLDGGQNGFRTDPRYPMFAMQAGSTIYIQTGACYAGIQGGGDTFNHYTERAQLCTVNLLSKSASYTVAGPFAFGIAGETGVYNHSMVGSAYSYNENNPNPANSDLVGMALLRYQTADEVLNRILSKIKRGVQVFFPEETEIMTYEEIAQATALKEGTYEKVISIKAEEEKEGWLERTYKLDPKESYFYEYKVKGLDDPSSLLSYSIETEREDEGYLTGDSYYVKRIETEDFNDKGKTNPFFTFNANLIEEGWWKGANLNKGSGELPNYVFSASSTIQFEIPEGEKAILSFDYEIAASAILSNKIYINGELWDRLPTFTGTKGHYTWPRFLKEGINTIQVYAADYGYPPSKRWTILDNLKVEFLDESPINEAETYPMTEPAENGFTKVKGVINTPFEVSKYSGFSGEYFYTNHSQPDPRAVISNVSTTEKKLTINVPANKFGLDPRLNVISKPVCSGTDCKNDNPINWSWAGVGSWICRYRTSANTQISQTPTNWTISMYEIAGSQVVTFKYSPSRGSSGSFGPLSYYEVDKIPKAHEESRYFYEEDYAEGVLIDKTLMLADQIFNGDCRLKLKIPENSEIYLKDLELYSMKDGHKVYVEEAESSWDDYEIKWEKADLLLENEDIKVETYKPEPTMVYKKGEKVAYKIHYLDYEEDPSKKGFWVYDHTPFTDGLHPDNGKVLNEPIDRFYIDGKYQVTHWQEDNTRRANEPRGIDGYPQGYPDYDKESNKISFTFFIEGEGSAPFITEISPQINREGQFLNGPVSFMGKYRFRIGVDDLEKDDLTLTTEIYREGTLLETFTETNIKANGKGIYPKIYTPQLLDPAKEGSYQVVCTVSDEMGAGLGTYRFTVERVIPRIRIHRLF